MAQIVYDDLVMDFYEFYDKLMLEDDHVFRLHLLTLLGAISESLEKIAMNGE